MTWIEKKEEFPRTTTTITTTTLHKERRAFSEG
jgi:hypothetical protein